jgi:phosphoglycerate kinase
MADTPDDKDLMYLDIGPRTIQLFTDLILQAKTVFWNGPVGVFEKEPFEAGTREIARAIAKSGAETFIGGGDTITAAKKFGFADRYDYVSSAGGAALEFLAGKKLPGLEILKK